MVETTLARTQGAYNLVTGLWPLLHMRSFEAVLGPKVDRWLVHTVSGLLIVNGAVQIARADSEEDVPRMIGIGTAAALAAIDFVYAPAGRISRMYLLDGVGQVGWIAAWCVAAKRRGRR